MNEHAQLRQFVEQWQDEPMKRTFLLFQETLQAMPGVSLDFVPRAGLTYSLRAKHEKQTDKPLFAMVDVIEGEPRWLSVCFYAELVSDPQEMGDFVPGGLLGEDAVCFDMEECSDALSDYLLARVHEAYSTVAS